MTLQDTFVFWLACEENSVGFNFEIFLYKQLMINNSIYNSLNHANKKICLPSIGIANSYLLVM